MNRKLGFLVLSTVFILMASFLSNTSKKVPYNECFEENRENYLSIRDSLAKYIIKFKGFNDSLNLKQIPISVEKDRFLGFYIKDLRDTLNNSLKNKCVKLIDNHVYYTSSYYLYYSVDLLFYWEKDKPKFWYTFRKDSIGNIKDSVKEAEQWHYIEDKLSLSKEELKLLQKRYYNSRSEIKTTWR